MAELLDDVKIDITKITGVELLRETNSFTTGKESKMSLATAYKRRHTNIRTQLFFVRCYNIPQFVAYHLRTHFTIYPMPPFEYGWMGSKRVDKGGADFRQVCKGLSDDICDIINGVYGKGMGDEPFEYHEDDDTNLGFIADEIKNLPTKFDRYAPTRFGFMVSAEGLMKIAETRLCIGAVAKETRNVIEQICLAIKHVDPDLYPFLVKPCVLYGFCKEKCCGYNKTIGYKKDRENFLKLFE